MEFKEINLIINTVKHDSEKARQSLVGAEVVKKLNSTLTQPEYKTILREAVVNAGGSCPKMVPYGKGGWLGLDWFSDQPTYESCLKYCDSKSVSPQNCPCATLFKGK